MPHFYFVLFSLFISVAAIVLLSRFLNLHAFFCLVIAGLMLGILTGKSLIDIIPIMQSGFGALLQQIGFIVALGSCLGIVLEKTGAMESISERLVYLFGQRKSPLALTTIGLLVGIPVFCDSGFIILSRLIPSIASSSAIPSPILSLSLSSALYTTHTLVPPTPGPLAAAANVGMTDHLALVIVVGIVASIPVGLVALIFARRLGTDVQSIPFSTKAEHHFRVAPLKAALPLVLPIVLIALGTLPKALGSEGLLANILAALGQPVVALAIGLAMALTLIQASQKSAWSAWMTEALKDAGVILLITGAGGAFGGVIKSTGIDQELKQYIADNETRGVTFLVFAYLIAAILKSAQGSTTSSLIVTSSLLAPLAAAAGFSSPIQLSCLLVAIGGGGMTVSHANDSYFWVVSQFGGIEAKDMFKSYTLLTLIQGLTALFISILLFLIW